eukprot:143307-Prymnesium_polylepis.1
MAVRAVTDVTGLEAGFLRKRLRTPPWVQCSPAPTRLQPNVGTWISPAQLPAMLYPQFPSGSVMG